MEKHFLVTVSEDRSALYGAKFMGRLYAHKEDIKLTLLYVAPQPAERFEGETVTEARGRQQKANREYQARGQEALDTAKSALLSMGFAREQVDVKLKSRKVSKIMDIIREGEEGRYDAVVLGRRGLTWLETVFSDSVTVDLLEKQCSFPIWVCRRADPDRRNILVGVDGSEASERIVDHVGFALSQERSHKVILLAVRKPKTAGDDIDRILAKSRDLVVRNGLPEDLVECRAIRHADVSKALLEEADRGKYAAVALGRTGTGDTGLRKLFMGSVSEALFKELDRAALWFCY